MVNKTEQEEKIKNLKFELEEYEKSKAKGRPSMSDRLVEWRQEELYKLQTTPQQRLADAKGTLANLTKKIGFDGATYETEKRVRREIANAETEIEASKLSEQDKKAIAEGNTTADAVYKRNIEAGWAKNPDNPKSPNSIYYKIEHGFKTTPPAVIQGDTRSLQPKGLHTPTAQEIVTKANQPDPTAPHYEEGGNVGRWVDPLKPHADFSGEVPRIVNPLKPGPKISGPA